MSSSETLLQTPQTPAPDPIIEAPVPCPHCAEPMQRLSRKPWMRLIPTSKRYGCLHCYKNYLQVAGKLFGE